jgi:hypothetical protein
VASGIAALVALLGVLAAAYRLERIALGMP